MHSPLSPVFQAHHNAVIVACQEEKHKILYFIRIVTDLTAKYCVSCKFVTSRDSASFFLKYLNYRRFPEGFSAFFRGKFGVEAGHMMCYNG